MKKIYQIRILKKKENNKLIEFKIQKDQIRHNNFYNNFPKKEIFQV